MQVPDIDIAIRSVHIDSDGAYLAAVNNKVTSNGYTAACSSAPPPHPNRAHVSYGVCQVEWGLTPSLSPRVQN